MNKKLAFFLSLSIILILGGIYYFFFIGEEHEFENVVVGRAIDGDTLELSTKEKVRLSGINTPEKNECYYKGAKEKLSELVAGKQVYLERDYTNKDKYHRLLRYVYVDNNEVNSILGQNGIA